MAKTQVEVITSEEQRRRGSTAEKERLVAASLEPGAAAVSALAHEAGLHPTQLYRWRRQLCVQQRAMSGFAPVRVIGEPEAPGRPMLVGVIEIELADGTRMRITGAVDTATMAATVAGAGHEGAAVMIAFPAGVGCGWQRATPT